MIISLNVGSSSLKFSFFDEKKRLLCKGEAEEIGRKDSFFWFTRNEKRIEEHTVIPDIKRAIELLFELLKHHNFSKPKAIGHRIVHGGEKFLSPTLINAHVIKTLKKLIPFAPLHLPIEIKTIEEIKKRFPNIPQIACFDTSFHRSMPSTAQLFPLTYALWNEGIKRYGFHGLSYEYIIKTLGEKAKGKRIIIAHLGNGASMCALFDGKPIDTTMGFTPTGGIMMGTRSGDLDPGILVYLLRQKKMTPDQLDELINHQSGLLGISEITGDMKRLLRLRTKEKKADLAISLFCYELCKAIGAFAAALNGLDLFIFTGGIGERASFIRARVLKHLTYLGIKLDAKRNEMHDLIITTRKSRCKVHVIPTNEDLMIAHHTLALLKKS